MAGSPYGLAYGIGQMASNIPGDVMAGQQYGLQRAQQQQGMQQAAQQNALKLQEGQANVQNLNEEYKEKVYSHNTQMGAQQLLNGDYKGAAGTANLLGGDVDHIEPDLDKDGNVAGYNMFHKDGTQTNMSADMVGAMAGGQLGYKQIVSGLVRSKGQVKSAEVRADASTSNNAATNATKEDEIKSKSDTADANRKAQAALADLKNKNNLAVQDLRNKGAATRLAQAGVSGARIPAMIQEKDNYKQYLMKNMGMSEGDAEDAAWEKMAPGGAASALYIRKSQDKAQDDEIKRLAASPAAFDPADPEHGKYVALLEAKMNRAGNPGTPSAAPAPAKPVAIKTAPAAAASQMKDGTLSQSGKFQWSSSTGGWVPVKAQ